MESIIAFSVLVVLIMSGLWIQVAVGLSALLYLFLMSGMAGWNALGLVSWGSANSFTLAAIPLFIFMAEILLGSGLSDRLYKGLAPFTRRLPGGLLHTNIVGSGIFAAVSGGSARRRRPCPRWRYRRSASAATKSASLRGRWRPVERWAFLFRPRSR